MAALSLLTMPPQSFSLSLLQAAKSRSQQEATAYLVANWATVIFSLEIISPTACSIGDLVLFRIGFGVPHQASTMGTYDPCRVTRIEIGHHVHLEGKRIDDDAVKKTIIFSCEDILRFKITEDEDGIEIINPGEAREQTSDELDDWVLIGEAETKSQNLHHPLQTIQLNQIRPITYQAETMMQHQTPPTISQASGIMDWMLRPSQGFPLMTTQWTPDAINRSKASPKDQKFPPKKQPPIKIPLRPGLRPNQTNLEAKTFSGPPKTPLPTWVGIHPSNYLDFYSPAPITPTIQPNSPSPDTPKILPKHLASSPKAIKPRSSIHAHNLSTLKTQDEVLSYITTHHSSLTNPQDPAFETVSIKACYKHDIILLRHNNKKGLKIEEGHDLCRIVDIASSDSKAWVRGARIIDGCEKEEVLKWDDGVSRLLAGSNYEGRVRRRAREGRRERGARGGSVDGVEVPVFGLDSWEGWMGKGRTGV